MQELNDAPQVSPLEAGIRSWTAPFAELVTGRRPPSPPAAPRVEANARLTATTGVVLLVLLAVEGVTLLSIRQLFAVHLFVGLLVIPPVLLKLFTTGRRFARYYLGDPAYRAAGPPPILLRLAGPLVVAMTVAVLGTGVELWLFGDRFGTWWRTAHLATFVVWFGVMFVHVIGHLERAPALAVRDAVDSPPLAGRGRRRAWLGAALLLGACLAVASLVYQTPFVIPLEH